MASRQTTDVVRHQVLVPAPAARVFTVFTEGLGRWWPREYSWSRILERFAAAVTPAGLGV